MPREATPRTASRGPSQSRPVAVLPSHSFRAGGPVILARKRSEASTEIDTLTANGRDGTTEGALDDGGGRGVGREPNRPLRLLRRGERSTHPPHRGADDGEQIVRSHARAARPRGPG